MKFLIVSHVVHTQKENEVYGYGPYVKEMNLWLKYVDEVKIVAPMQIQNTPDKIDLAYKHENLSFIEVSSFNLVGLKEKLFTLIKIPFIFFSIIKAMLWAEHIHLRCPGNMGLLGAVAQVFFPWKTKTVKYAGNWDSNSPQPFTYRLQRKIISNTTFSKNMQVLVYGKWPNQSKNILEFFTATYHENEKEDVALKTLDGEIKLMFVGALSSGKQPMIALKAVRELVQQNVKVCLDIMGEGSERAALEGYIKENDLAEFVTLHGNQNSDFVKEKYKKAHFLILMSKSEGWPKVVAEAMFWGALPITSNVSCVNYMIGEGSRGTLVESDAKAVAKAILSYMDNPNTYEQASKDAIQWSRQFTLESFENAIRGLLHG